MLFDTHGHLYLDKRFKENNKTISNFVKFGGAHCLQVGIDVASSRECIDLSREYDICHATIGLHPTSAHDLSFDEINEGVEKLLRLYDQHSNFVVALGEIGRDHHWLDKDPEIAKQELEKQQYAFFLQTELAKKLDLPIIIHTRDCSAETLRWIQESGIRRFVIHCFSDEILFAEEVLNVSDEAMISFTCNITYPKAGHIRDVASWVPLDRIMIETDSPFLPPQHLRGKGENEPANVRYVLEQIQELRSEDPDEVEKVIFENSCKFFGVN